MIKAADLVKEYDMMSHPEGGYFKETYRSAGEINKDSLPSNMDGKRTYSTGIYFLLESGDVSRFHRIKSDEMWHFYLGGPLKVVEIHDDGTLVETLLGQNILEGEVVQYTVAANTWFGSFPAEGSEYSFVGCTVAPGFDFADFELANQEDLLKIYPQHENLIKKLT